MERRENVDLNVVTFAFLMKVGVVGASVTIDFLWSVSVVALLEMLDLRRRPRLTPQIKYDVFISFRGSDIRYGFLSHLLVALSQKGIDAYVDYKLREGNELSTALNKAIEESQIALVIFSEDFASSRWCLEELSKITECRTENGQIVIPIFYKVDPSDVRHQKGCYESAFAKHEKTNVKKWRTALKEVANLSGFHSTNFGTEAKLVEEIVKRLLTRLNHIRQMDLEGLVGINKQITDLESRIIGNGSEDVRAIGICGMGGIGKTTIAGALFNILCSEFEGCYFLANVREQLEKDGIIRLRDKLLSVLLEEKDLNNGVPNGVPAYVLTRLRRKKILVILDDVSNIDQVQKLVGEPYWLGPGSRIIITTRDKHVVCKADHIHEVEALEFDEARKLLSLHAFDGKWLQMDCYNSVMLEMVRYAAGVPLALKVLGSFLYGKSVEEWESQLQKLQKMPFAEIQKVLRLSYEGLDPEERNIFLYMACFFKNHEEVKILLDACGYSTAIALRTLHDRALIDASACTMHDLIREMGREIVREQSFKTRGKQSHLWDPNDIAHVLKRDEGTEYIESITLDMSKVTDQSLNPHSFARMVNLKLLRFHNNVYGSHSRVHLPEGLGALPDELKLFHWDYYPLKSLPATLNAKHLVQLLMSGSHVEKLWDGEPDLVNLRRIELSESKQLIELPNLSNASRLENLCLHDCIKLRTIHSSILYHPKLSFVALTGCRRLENLPAIEALPSSERCPGKLGYLCLLGCESLKHLPDSMSELRSLEFLNLNGCKQLDTSNLHILLESLPSLKFVSLSGDRNFCEFLENISNLSSLRYSLHVQANVKSFPESIKHLSITPRLLKENYGLFEIVKSKIVKRVFHLKIAPILEYARRRQGRRRAIWEKRTGKQRRR